MNELLSIVPLVSFLRDEDEDTRRSFASLGTCRTFPKGNILYHHGDQSLAAYVIVSGKVKLIVAGEDGRELALEMFGPGSMCGLIAALDNGPHAGTAITTRTSRIAIIPHDAFNHWLAQRPLLQRTILFELANLLRHAYDRVGTQTLLSVKLRVRAALVDLAREDGTLEEPQELVVARPTHQELAERVGSTRVVVSRALKALLEEEEDAFRMVGRTLRVRLELVEPETPPRSMYARPR